MAKVRSRLNKKRHQAKKKIAKHSFKLNGFYIREEVENLIHMIKRRQHV